MVRDLRVKAIGNRSDYSIGENLDRLYLSAQVWILAKIRHDLPRNFVYENAVNELSFLLVTHTDYFDIRFGCYRFLKLGYGAELFWTAWTLERNPNFKGPKMSESG
jgi:hypothetical protein